MKKILLLLIIPFLSFGQKEVDYKSESLTFSYYDTYTLDPSTYVSEVNVKLTCNNCKEGALDNIGLNYIPIDGNQEINMNELFNTLKKEVESGYLRAGINVEYSLVKTGEETVNNKDVPYIISKTHMRDYNQSMFQKMYAYQTATKTYQVVLTTGTMKDLSKKQKDIDLVLKTLNIK